MIKILVGIAIFSAVIVYLLMREAAEYEEEQEQSCSGDCAVCDACACEEEE